MILEMKCLCPYRSIPSSYVQAPTLNTTVFGDGLDFIAGSGPHYLIREVVKVRWGHDGRRALSRKRLQGAPVMWAHREAAAAYEPKEVASEWNLPCQHLDHGFPSLLRCEPSRLWYVVIEAHADKSTCLVGAFVNCYQKYLPCWEISVLSFLHLHYHQLTWGLRLPTARLRHLR